MRILVIDDHAALREIIADLFLLEGEEVVAVATLEAGHSALAEGHFDIVLCDSISPSGTIDDGVLLRLQELAAVAHPTPVVLMTGYGEAEELNFAAYGLAGVLLKPFEVDDLMRRVSAWVQP